MTRKDRQHLVETMMYSLANRGYPYTAEQFRAACERGWTIDTRLPSHEYIGEDFTRVHRHQFTAAEIAEIIMGADL